MTKYKSASLLPGRQQGVGVGRVGLGPVRATQVEYATTRGKVSHLNFGLDLPIHQKDSDCYVNRLHMPNR
jgi:hypothetical protein